MNMNAVNPSFWSATQIAAAIRTKSISATECLEHYLNRISHYNNALNAVVVLDEERARQRAKEADLALAKGDSWGTLHGVPMTVKEAYDIAGLPTTWGIEALRENIPQNDSLSVARLKSAGAIIFGKTNVPTGLADWQTFNPVYGTTNNPWDHSRGPGGSSGGSAAALAAGLTSLEAGSDIGASIRNPSHYCGVYGHKPTYGVVSDKGHRLPDWTATPGMDIAAVGPMARSADDLALALNTMSGPDEIDGVGWNLSLPESGKHSLKEFRVGMVYSDVEAEVDAAVQGKLHDLTTFLLDAGAEVMEDYKPQFASNEAHRTYISLLRAATSTEVSESTIAAYQGLIQNNPDTQNYEAMMQQAVCLTHREWLFINETRHRMRLAWQDYFQGVDLLLCPAATTVAFEHNQQGERWERMIDVNGNPQPTTTALFWAGYSGHVYLPSTVAPIGLSGGTGATSGLPVGVQIIGPQYHDYRCIRFAQLLEKEYCAFTAPPQYL